MNEPVEDLIEVMNPRTLGASHLPAARIPVGVVGDYKPCIARLPHRELLMVMFHPNKLADGRYQEDLIVYRSADGGVTWSEREAPPLLGREPYLTVLGDGTILITAALLIQDWRNADGYVYSLVHRSTDSGRTWQTMRIGAEEVTGAPAKETIITTRTVLELSDGTLLLGASAPRGRDFLWRSHDGGKSWDRSLACDFIGMGTKQVECGFFGEAVLWETRSGALLAIHRVDPRWFPALPGTELPFYTNDNVERMIVLRSEDRGRTWRVQGDLGDYGEMYPALLRLQDRRMLLTFTVRALKERLGVQAVLGAEDDEGLHFDFEHDRLMLDAKTPPGKMSGGGYGPTVQMEDGTLITSYSYRGEDDETHVEVVRWRLRGAR